MARLARPSAADLNALFEPAAIDRTQKHFREEFGGRYKLGRRAALIPGLSAKELAVWRQHLDEDLPRSIDLAARAVVLRALGSRKKPIPIRSTYKPGRTLEVAVSEASEEAVDETIASVMKGPSPRRSVGAS